MTAPAAVFCFCWAHVIKMDCSLYFWTDFGPWPHLPQFLKVLKLQEAQKYYVSSVLMLTFTYIVYSSSYTSKMI